MAEEAGFHSTTLPMSAGDVGRLPAILVKLKGVTAKTKPSSGRCSIEFQTPGGEYGCRLYSSSRYATLKRKKSIISQAESISAWCAVLDCPSIVAAFSVCRRGPASRSAARRKIAARWFHGIRDHTG